MNPELSEIEVNPFDYSWQAIHDLKKEIIILKRKVYVLESQGATANEFSRTNDYKNQGNT